MPNPDRASDVVEGHTAQALTYGVSGLVAAGLSGLFYAYRGQTGVSIPLAIVLAIIALGLIGYALYKVTQIGQVTHYTFKCPYCQATNDLISAPVDDIRCGACNRLIPIRDGQPLPVEQVRCGYCSTLNYFSEKTDLLLCEDCNREVPIARDEMRPAKTLAPAFRVVDDDRPYELVLIGQGAKTEELITSLQHMLALNRNQVKQILAELPAVLLTGIPRRKADILKSQLEASEGVVELRALD
jgi:phage FluMu protein Com